LHARLGDYDQAPRLKLREATDRIHDRDSWNQVKLFWRKAREQELEELDPPDTAQKAIRAARACILLQRPEQGVVYLQAFRQRAKKNTLGQLLFELGRCFALQNRYDLAICCHREAATHLTGASQQTENRFLLGVALAYLQQLDEAREVFASILTVDFTHAGARRQLERLSLPDGILQLHQLAELTCQTWNEILTEDSEPEI